MNTSATLRFGTVVDVVKSAPIYLPNDVDPASHVIDLIETLQQENDRLRRDLSQLRQFCRRVSPAPPPHLMGVST